MADTRVGDLADEVLDGVVAVFADAGVTLPSRQLVHAAEPADDCEQVAVWFGRLFQGLPPSETLTQQPHLVRSLEVNVRITRCVPVADDNGNPPSASSITAASHTIGIDMATLAYGLAEFHVDGDFLAACQNLLIGPVAPFAWTGGIGGCELALAIQVL